MSIFLRLLGYLLYTLVILGANNLLGITRNKLGVENYFILGVKDTSGMSDGWNLFLHVFMSVFGVIYGLVFIGMQSTFEPTDSTVLLWGLTAIAFVMGVRATSMLFTKVNNRKVEGLGIHWLIYLFSRNENDIEEYAKYNFLIDIILWSGIATAFYFMELIIPSLYFGFSIFGLIVISFVRLATTNRIERNIIINRERDLIHQRVRHNLDSNSTSTQSKSARRVVDKNSYGTQPQRKGGRKTIPRVSY